MLSFEEFSKQSQNAIRPELNLAGLLKRGIRHDTLDSVF